MENVTPGNPWALLLAVASAVVLLSNAVEKIAGAVRAAKAPNIKQDERINEIEERLKKVEQHLGQDNTRLDVIERGNRASQQALLALLDHGIDGNNITQMQHAKEELQTYLINR